MLVSWNDIINNNYDDYKNLLKKTFLKAQSYEKNYGKDDSRKEFFITMSETNVWVLIQFKDFLDTVNQNKKIEQHLNLNQESRIIILEQFDTINRSSYLTKCMFDVEYFIKSILDYFGKSIEGGYGLLVDRFLEVLNIKNDQKTKILKLPASVRNALHNNGYTKYPINTTTLRGRTFSASKGDQISFSGWDNIHIMIDELMDLFIDIVDNSKINSENNIPKKSHFIV